MILTTEQPRKYVCVSRTKLLCQCVARVVFAFASFQRSSCPDAQTTLFHTMLWLLRGSLCIAFCDWKEFHRRAITGGRADVTHAPTGSNRCGSWPISLLGSNVRTHSKLRDLLVRSCFLCFFVIYWLVCETFKICSRAKKSGAAGVTQVTPTYFVTHYGFYVVGSKLAQQISP